ncbi:uncharacterized protein [Lolium perenne]|uniref:uncharacterized protein n=1 Tax=Lolium perenne TaxID=4522 RepID=UPI0021F672A5|nr:uncharacterized protein LOC127313414 [Lolium perenne]
MVQIAVTTYGLADHLTTATPPADDDEWLRMDATVLCWLYGSVTPEVTDMVMESPTTAYSIWLRIVALFRDNQQARAGYLGQKFRNIEQEGKSITAYCLEQKTVADALGDVGAPVADDALVWNVLKGLDSDYDHIAALVPLLTPFPSFLQLRNMLLLQELKPHHGNHAPAPAALYTNTGGGGAPGYRGLAPPHPPPPGYGPPPAYDPPAPAPPPFNPNGGRPKGKRRKVNGAPAAPGGAPAAPTPSNPWTGSIYMYPMGTGILGPRPGAASPRPAVHGFMASPQAAAPAPYGYYNTAAPYGYAPATPAPYGYAPTPTAPSWDATALINQLNAMSLQPPPTEWVMDTGASAHMSSDAGPLYQGGNSQVQ